MTAKFANLTEDLWYREVAKDVFHVIERYEGEVGKAGEWGEGYELSEIDLYIVPMSLIKEAMKGYSCDDSPLSEPDEKHRFGKDTEMVLECLHSHGSKAQLDCEHGKTLARMKKSSEKFSKDGPRRIQMEKAANRYGTTHHHCMLGLLDRSVGVTPPCFDIECNGQVHKDPLAFISGFTAGLRLELMPLMRKGFAKAYVEGFRRGIEVRLGKETIPSGMTVRKAEQHGPFQANMLRVRGSVQEG
jgi:hypothetical protein